ncbi:hypothetical protein ACQKCH_16740 [Nubsella zeaxanthinifaciens]|uniref:hypothetical protein n=1 Tax=Nubsella zeaxanthinifaciens TaxID=392412 RepID=UPI003D067587
MKKIYLTLAFLSAFCFFAKAQFNIGAGATYTNYAGDIKKAAPGVHLRGNFYIREKYGIGLGFSYSTPIKSTYTEDEFAFERTSSFMGLSLLTNLHLIGTYESDFSLYFPLGATYQMGKNKYKFNGNLPSATSIDVADESLNGFVLNLNIGLQYRIGNPYLFAEAGIGLAAGTTTYNSRDGYTANNNPAPGSTVLQLGIRIPFGSGVGGGVY